MERQPGKLHIGEQINPQGERSGEAVLLDSADFTTHGVIVGMTGSGKTGLGMVLLEEALLSGVPVLAIDPKGDLGNLALTFPDLAADDFEPWIDDGTARVEQTTVPELAARTAELWKSGLASWDLDGADVRALSAAAKPVIYTPGSTAGIPLNALGRLAAPESTDPAIRQDEADSTISGLLGLVGIQSDPLSGREHVLMANLIMRAWDQNIDLDLPTLLGQLIDPPIRKLGVLDLDTFFPPADRQALVVKLNGLLASPSFAAWAEGEPLDIGSMLYNGDGSPRAAIVSLSHLEESEQQFAITLLLSRVISWMRTQSGTSELRALIYIDEVMGLAPPVGNPPAKKPILTLLKQARAFGVGLVLSTQNPVDLDYKAISNAGTWLIGRLQTEQDKNRLVDGLRSADGGIDVAEVERIISGLGKRQFVLRTTRANDLPLLTTRWAMSYLAGPMTRDQISNLMAGQRSAATSEENARVAPVSGAATSSADAPPPALADNESTLPPKTPDNLLVRFAHVSAPWLDAVEGSADGKKLRPALAARVNLLFDDTKADLRHSEEWEAIIPISGDAIDIDLAITVDFDDRDFGTKAPESAVYVTPDFNLTKTALKAAQTALTTNLYANQTIALLRNPDLKLWSRPGETAEEFARRCDVAAESGQDKAAAKIREKLEKKNDSVLAALAKAEDRVAELETQKEGRRTQQLVDLGGSILGSLLGGRRSARSMAGAARRVASGRRQSSSTEARLETAQNRVAEKIELLEELEVELEDAMIEIDDEWAAKIENVEEVEVRLEKTDITIEDFLLVWIPTN
ncbi:MAG: hypothetical protein ACI8TP_004498 [Acidimicrobiales bacterium]|jgi:hypothetical protein